ncbi:unnamed protein product, partial [Ceratitis capitata]
MRQMEIIGSCATLEEIGRTKAWYEGLLTALEQEKENTIIPYSLHVVHNNEVIPFKLNRLAGRTLQAYTILHVVMLNSKELLLIIKQSLEPNFNGLT